MSPAPTTLARIASAVAPLGAKRLDESLVEAQLAPLFSRALARGDGRSYLANHSLGRPLDAMEDDVREALALWYSQLGGAWDGWMDEHQAHRARIAALAGASRPDCIVPRTSAGQGLRAVLASFDDPPRVVATRGEFDSLDVILREHARRGRLSLAMVAARDDGRFATADVLAAITPGTDLVVVSQVLFQTGQLLADLPAIVAKAHEVGARVLLDVYHSLGVVPVDLGALGVEFAVGGCYKYLRGGPGACFLYVAPALLDAGLRTLDIGWFAKEATFAYQRPEPPRLAAGGDAWLESTPPILTFYQARAGLEFTQAVGVARLREYSLAQQRRLVALLAQRGVPAVGGSGDRGAFVVVRRDDAVVLAQRLGDRGIIVDARGPCLRLCPDVLTTSAELERAAAVLSELAG
jgi:kynureninase